MPPLGGIFILSLSEYGGDYDPPYFKVKKSFLYLTNTILYAILYLSNISCEVFFMVKTVNMSFEEKDLALIDAYCIGHNLTRSKFMIQLAIDAISRDKQINLLSNLSMCANRLMVKDTLSDDERVVLGVITQSLKVGGLYER